MLELDEGQLSRPVLRGGGGGNAASLPDYQGLEFQNDGLCDPQESGAWTC